MTETRKTRTYDLEERTFTFAAKTMRFVRGLPKNVTNVEVVRQLVRSAGSVGANYIEANEALSKKDFLMRIRISRKEAKESVYWFRLLDVPPGDAGDTRTALACEATELMRIFGAILVKSEARMPKT